jgi:hypothetical protein
LGLLSLSLDRLLRSGTFLLLLLKSGHQCPRDCEYVLLVRATLRSSNGPGTVQNNRLHLPSRVLRGLAILLRSSTVRLLRLSAIYLDAVRLLVKSVRLSDAVHLRYVYLASLLETIHLASARVVCLLGLMG